MKIGLCTSLSRPPHSGTGGTHKITATAGAGGTISPSGSIDVEPGGRQAYTITPNAGYHVASLVIDGTVPSDLKRWWEFSNVHAGHTIAATFAATTSPVAQVTRGYSLLAIGCPHVGQGSSSRWARVATCLAWGLAQAKGLTGILVAGDMVVSPATTTPLHTWLYDSEGGNVPADIPLIPVLGNHDAEVPNGGDYGITPAAPHASTISTFAEYFRGREWHAWDATLNGKPTDLRVICLNNNSPYLDDEGTQMYHNCNPPGRELALDPDHSGITVEGSPQRLFLDEATKRRAGKWTILSAHRSLWAPFDSDPRKLHRSMRPVLKDSIDRGASILLTADIHLTSHSGPWYPTAPNHEEYRANGSVGIHSVTVAGGFMSRSVDDTVLPEHATSCHFAHGYETADGVTHAVLLQFEGDHCSMRVFEVTPADLDGAEVYSATIKKNPGGA